MNPEFERMLDVFKKRAVEISKVVKADALVGAQMGKHKVKELDMERQKIGKLFEIGKKALALHKKGKLSQPDLKKLSAQIVLLEKEITKHKASYTTEKKKLKKVSFK